MLDFDGVIITYRTQIMDFKLNYWGAIDPVATQFLHNICKEGNISIVVSSSWRANKDACFNKLKEANLFQFLHSDWQTEQSEEGRGVQIDNWLKAHPEVKEYIILDDVDYDMLPDQIKNNHFILCDSVDGMEYEAMKKVKKWADKIKGS